MRKAIVVTLALIFVAVLYFGSSVLGLKRLGDAVAAGNSEEVLARTNLPRLRRSLADQALAAYRRRSDKPKASTPLRQLLVVNVEGNVADAVIARMVTAQNLTDILRNGRLDDPEKSVGAIKIPALGDVKISDALSRFRIVNFATIAFRINSEGAEVLMRFEPYRWKLSGLRIPAALADQLADRIIEQREKSRRE